MKKITDRNTLYSLAVIGCGLTGTSMIYQLISKVKKNMDRNTPVLEPIKIIVFEQTSNMGPGLPYGKSNLFSFHLSNMPARDMSIVADRPDDFINWFFKHKRTLEMHYPELIPYLSQENFNPSNNSFLPRMVMGEYLKSRLDEALKKAAAYGIQVVIQKERKVIDIKEKKENFIILSTDQKTQGIQESLAERVFLATGHWFSKSRQNGYFASPWPAQTLLANIPKCSKVAVLGTSLSAIDTALTLLSDGHFSRKSTGVLTYSPATDSRQVTFYSRNGLLPKVRGRIGPHQNHFFSISRLNSLMTQKHGSLRLEELFQLLNRELETAYNRSIDWKSIFNPAKNPLSILRQDIRMAHKGDNPNGDILWQTILFQAIPLMKQAYINLIPSHRHWFETDFKSVFMTHAAVIPLVNAEKILAFMESGVLKVKKLQDTYQWKPLLESNGFEFIYPDHAGEPMRDDCHFIVDARGQSPSYRSNPSDLAQNMLRSGLVQIETCTVDENTTEQHHSPGIQKTVETGGVWIDPQTCRVMKKSMAQGVSISKNLFAVGIMNRGQIINASMAQECAVSANLAAGYILNDIMKSH
jgi:uncharacterized NAD(P)/FAD-binding protein YdhS